MASNGSRFMVTWIIFKKPPLGRRLNTKPGDYGITNTHNCRIILFYHMWRLAWIEVHWNNIWVRARSHVASPYTREPVTTLHDFEGVLGRPLDAFFGLSQYHGHGSWLVCEVALKKRQDSSPHQVMEHATYFTQTCLDGLMQLCGSSVIWNQMNMIGALQQMSKEIIGHNQLRS
jgi:hypothetical protein